MPQETAQHTGAWVVFTQASFVASAVLVGFGILFMPLDLWMKGYLAMGTVMLIQSCITATKTLRDVHEARRMVNRIEDARTERLLMSVGKE
ncbi:YiaAB helix domain-containing protein [Methylorubrum populi]|uniref:YiaAB helix domain-containing protein n=1 Tax=Methylorubrum populi TaxID=223967 RepID=A0A160PGG2_9HYPH|nr:YiaA/YiaB family inner membrane protein [Methylorubrum populi]BAU91854.1 YiaAB helix domain-containing protein [Methylorubrum populi]